MSDNTDIYTQEDFSIHKNVLVVKYEKLDYNRHKYGFEKGVAVFFNDCISKGVDTVLLDLDDTSHVESLTLGTIVKFKSELKNINLSKMRLANIAPDISDIIIMQNLDEIFGKPYDSVEEALEELIN